MSEEILVFDDDNESLSEDTSSCATPTRVSSNQHEDKVDSAWYLKEYPDVAAFGIDPVQHYLRYGRKEGRYRSQAHKSVGTLRNIFIQKKDTELENTISDPVILDPAKNFIDIYFSPQSNEENVIVEQSHTSLIDDISCSEELFGIVVWATESYFSTNCLETLQNYARQNIPIAIIADDTIRTNKALNPLISKLKPYRVKIYYLPPITPALCRLQLLESLRCTYVAIFSMLDTINQRSYVDYVKNILEEQVGKKIFAFDTTYEELLATCQENPSLSSLSGVIFHRKTLLTICENLPRLHFFISELLLHSYKKESFCTLSSEKKFFRKHEAINFSLTEVSLFIKDSQFMIDKDQNFIHHVIHSLEYIVSMRMTTNTKTNNDSYSILSSGCAILCSRMYGRFTESDFRKIVYSFSTLFHFDRLCCDVIFHNRHRYIVSKIIPIKEKTIAVVETDFMQDLLPHFVPACRKQCEVIYISKPQYYDYHWFYCMVMRAIIQPAQFVVTSNYMHTFITSGKGILTLWHGLGLLKNITVVDTNTYPMDAIVTSSQDCVQPWSKTFSLPEEHVFPLGNVNTDVLYDTHYVAMMNTQIRKKYGLSSKTKIVFFAPTFRDGEVKTYDFGINIEEFADLLKEKNIFVMVKRHHVFAHTMRDKHVDTSGLHTSQNGWFTVDEEFTFVELMCAADAFMTDYSSGLFYALIRNLPLVLYAPDVESYDTTQHGFMINYPDDIPAEFVGVPNASLLVAAMHKTLTSRLPKEYAVFKEHHVGACDGMSTERCVRLVQDLLPVTSAVENSRLL